MILESIFVLGLNQKPKQVLVNGNSAKFSFETKTTLSVDVNADLLAPLNVTWT